MRSVLVTGMRIPAQDPLACILPSAPSTRRFDPPAKAGAPYSMASMAGVGADSIEVNASASSGGFEGMSQAGTRKASIAPTPLPGRRHSKPAVRESSGVPWLPATKARDG